jgi:hypothetical protein
MLPIGCTETSLRNYHYSLRNSPAELRSHPLRGGSLKSRFNIFFLGLKASSLSAKNLNLVFIKRYVFCESKDILWNIRNMRASWNTVINFAQKCSCCGNHTTAARLVLERRLRTPFNIFTAAIHQMRDHWSTSFCGYGRCVVCRHFSRTADVVTLQETSCQTADSLRIGWMTFFLRGGGGGRIIVTSLHHAIGQRILGKPKFKKTRDANRTPYYVKTYSLIATFSCGPNSVQRGRDNSVGIATC